MGGGWKAKKGNLMEARSLFNTKTRREMIKVGISTYCVSGWWSSDRSLGKSRWKGWVQKGKDGP